MTEKLKDMIMIPRWVIILFVTSFISVFATGWVKIDNIKEELVIEKTSRFYIEQMLQKIDRKLDKIETRIERLED